MMPSNSRSCACVAREGGGGQSRVGRKVTEYPGPSGETSKRGPGWLGLVRSPEASEGCRLYTKSAEHGSWERSPLERGGHAHGAGADERAARGRGRATAAPAW
eukprot:2634928-Prymnesium_polylepis.1